MAKFEVSARRQLGISIVSAYANAIGAGCRPCEMKKVWRNVTIGEAASFSGMRKSVLPENKSAR